MACIWTQACKLRVTFHLLTDQYANQSIIHQRARAEIELGKQTRTRNIISDRMEDHQDNKDSEKIYEKVQVCIIRTKYIKIMGIVMV